MDLLTLLVRNFGDLYNDADKNTDNNCVQISTCATLLMAWWCWNRCYTFFITRAQFVGLRSWTLILWSPVKVVFPTYWYIIFELSSPILVSSPIDDWYIGFKISSSILIYRFQGIIIYIDISVSKYNHLVKYHLWISPWMMLLKKNLKLMFSDIEARLIFHTVPDIKLCSNSHQIKVAIRNQCWKSFGAPTMI